MNQRRQHDDRSTHLFCVGSMVLRSLDLLPGFVAAATLSAQAAYACSPDALGTTRTIKLDPAKVKAVAGLEKSLGLKHKEVILTFDDGPIPGRTSAILKALDKECVKATFFYVGKMARAYPRLVRKVVSRGHTLGHHTWSHERLPKYKIEAAAKAIEKGIATVEKAAYGQYDGAPRVPFFRYPYLASNPAVRKLARDRGLITFDANIDSRDWKKVSADAVHDRIMKRLKQDGRGIVLMHDIQNRTVKMLPRLLRSLNDAGYKVAHVVPAKRGTKPADPIVVASALPPVTKPTPRSVVAVDQIKLDEIVTAATQALETPVRWRAKDEIANLPSISTASVRTTAPPLPAGKAVSLNRELARAQEAQLRPRRISASVVSLGARPIERVVLGTPERPTTLGKTPVHKKRQMASLAASWKLRRSQWIIR